MATQTAPLGLRLFLEGVEVPVISAQVNIQPGAAAAAVIQVVPTDSALLLLPRTLVHLFYLDNEFLDSTSPDLTSTSHARGEPLRLQDDQGRYTVADEQYRLLFGGEIIGYNYQKSPTGRAMILQCLDFSTYWDTCYQWYAEYAVGGTGLTDKHHNFVGAGGYLFNDVAAGTKWVISNILNSKPESPLYKNTTGLLAGYIHLLEVIGGVRPSKAGDYKAYRGVNDFFTIAELMYKITAMLGAVQSDKTSARMFAAKAFRHWLKNGMSSAGSLVSFRDTLNIVGQYIFHDVYPNPAAYYVPHDATTTQRISRTTKARVEAGISKKMEEAKREIQASKSSLFGPGINPAKIQDVDCFVPLTRASTLLSEVVRELSAVKSAAAPKIRSSLSLAHRIIEETKLIFDLGRGVSTVTTEGSILANDQNDIGSGRKYYYINAQAAEKINNNLAEALEHLNRGVAASGPKTSYRDVSVPIGEHLFNQLLLPETFFVAPPRCNVLFPDMYMSFNFSRNFLREVSRLACQGGLGMIAQGSGAGILGRHYFAPNIKANGKVVRRTVFSSGTTLMPHEVHTGIIPKFEWVTDGHRWGVNASKGKGSLTQGKKISYIQRLANFQFFTHRWSARQMSATCRFNPQMVIGFPGVIVDRLSPNLGVLSAVGGRFNVGTALLPTAYVGKVAALQHSVHQDGGETSVTYSHCRTHRGVDDEFLGVLKRESVAAEAVPITVVPAVLLENLKQGSRVDDTELQIMQMWLKGRLIENQELVFGKVAGITGVDNPTYEISFDDAVLFGVTYDDIVTLQSRQVDQQLAQDDFSLSTTTVRVPESIQVVLEVVSREGQAVPVEDGGPIEDVLRPGWYSEEVWDNARITGAVYSPLLGSAAITDDALTGDPDQFEQLSKAVILDIQPDADITTEELSPNVFALKVNGEVASVMYYSPTKGRTIETAIDSLIMMYGMLKRRGLDVQEFIDDYVKRPVANMVQILGDSDFQLGSDGEPKARPDGTIPYEGFHSRAFGPYNVNVQFRAQIGDAEIPPVAGDGALLGLLPSDPAQRKAYVESGNIIRKSKDGKKTTIRTDIPAHLDPRGRAQARVRVYVDELKFSRGLLGT